MKKKERAPTIEELKERLKIANAPLWQHSEPLFSIVTSPEGLKLFPLHESCEQSTLLVLLLDLTDYTSEAAQEILEEWASEYRGLPWKTVIIYQNNYLFMKSTGKFTEQLKASEVLNASALLVDPQGEWFEYFQAGGKPSILLLHRGNVLHRESLDGDFDSKIEAFESRFQEVLRLEDPGLSLFEVSRKTTQKPRDRKIISTSEFIQGGNWIQAAGSIMTEDSTGTLQFNFQGNQLRMIATLHPQARANCRFQVLLNNEPIKPQMYGKNVHQGDKGSAVSEVNKASGVFELVDSDNEVKGMITIKFQNALENPVIIYSFKSA
jgi:hypothetical protein